MKRNIILSFLLFLTLFGKSQNINYAGKGESNKMIFNLSAPNTYSSVGISNSQNWDINQAKPLDINQKSEIIFNPIYSNFIGEAPFTSYSFAWKDGQSNPDNSIIKVRYSKNNTDWSNWEIVHLDEHAYETKYPFTSELYYKDKFEKYSQIKIETNILKTGFGLSEILINPFNPSNINTPPLSTEPPVVEACPCVLPTYTTRSQWGGVNASSYSYTTVTHLIVHHSAGPNTSSNWNATVLSIFNSHTVTNGWADIGYNWLIAPDGTLFEGRGGGNNVIGAHYCGLNGGTMGVCMLGTYTTANISTIAKETLVKILSWKCCNSNVNPLGSTNHSIDVSGNVVTQLISNINGHQSGCATSCPGTTVWNDLPNIRNDVSSYINTNCTTTALQDFGENIVSVSVAPNPANTKAWLNLNILKPQMISYSIINNAGQIVLKSNSKSYTGKINIDINGFDRLPKGIYKVQIMANNKKASLNIVKL